MGMSIDNSIRLLEDHHKWEKKYGMFGSGVDDATKKLLEVAKKYQKIQEILRWNNAPSPYYKTDGDLFREICEVLEDGED